jgi:acyl carrier protein
MTNRPISVPAGREGLEMNRDEFLVALSELLEKDPPLTGAEELSDLGGWDSVAVISFMAMADDKWGAVSLANISKCNTVDDLMALVRLRTRI